MKTLFLFQKLGLSFLLAGGLFLMGACASSAPGRGAFDKMVLEDDTEYFEHAPSAYAPPDGRFSRGTRVRIIGDAGEYLQVETPTGKEAYVRFEKIGDLDTSKSGGIKF